MFTELGIRSAVLHMSGAGKYVQGPEDRQWMSFVDMPTRTAISVHFVADIDLLLL